MANNNNTKRIENLEEMMSKLIESQTAMMAMMSSMQKPSTARGAKAKTETVKASKSTAPKALKTYAPFEKSTESYTAKAVESKGGNPNAKLQVKFNAKPNAKAIALLKAYGFRWNSANLSWDNANTDEAKEVFLILK
jgi:hypothetical protein